MDIEHRVSPNNHYFPIDVTTVIIRSPMSSVGTDWLDSYLRSFEYCKETSILYNRVTKLFPLVTRTPSNQTYKSLCKKHQALS